MVTVYPCSDLFTCLIWPLGTRFGPIPVVARYRPATCDINPPSMSEKGTAHRSRWDSQRGTSRCWRGGRPGVALQTARLLAALLLCLLIALHLASLYHYQFYHPFFSHTYCHWVFPRVTYFFLPVIRTLYLMPEYNRISVAYHLWLYSFTIEYWALSLLTLSLSNIHSHAHCLSFTSHMYSCLQKIILEFVKISSWQNRWELFLSHTHTTKFPSLSLSLLTPTHTLSLSL